LSFYTYIPILQQVLYIEKPKGEHDMATITISGLPNSGKSTTADILGKLIGYKRYYTGGIFREMAAERHMTIDEFYPTVDAATEQEVDRRQEEHLRNENNIIVEGRIAPFLASEKKKIKLFFTVSQKESITRERRRNEKCRAMSDGALWKIISGRIDAERAHYRKLYPHIADHLDPSAFDIIIDTTEVSKYDVLLKVLKEIITEI